MRFVVVDLVHGRLIFATDDISEAEYHANFHLDLFFDSPGVVGLYDSNNGSRFLRRVFCNDCAKEKYSF